MSSQLLLLMLMSCGAAFVQRVSGFGCGMLIYIYMALSGVVAFCG